MKRRGGRGACVRAKSWSGWGEIPPFIAPTRGKIEFKMTLRLKKQKKARPLGRKGRRGVINPGRGGWGRSPKKRTDQAAREKLGRVVTLAGCFLGIRRVNTP